MTTRNAFRTILTGTSALALAVAGTVFISGPATAAAFPVTTELELSDAIDAANLTPALDIITLGADIALTAYLPSITEDLEIVGNNHTIDAGHAPIEVFYDLGATANIDLTFTGVTIENADLGLGIDTRFSNVTITDSTFYSAAVQISGTDIAVTVSASTFDNTLLWDGLNVTAMGASTVNVSASSADGNTYDGFGLEVGDASTLSFTESTATVNQRAGVDIDTNEFATATVTGITADTNGSFGQSGIDIRSDDDSTVTVSRISVNGNDHEGLDANAHARSSVTVAESNASNNDDDGFDADTYGPDASVMFTNSVSTSNDGQGFDFTLNAGTATGTGLTSTGNVGGGLAVLGEVGTVLVSDSTFDGSTDGPGVRLIPDDGTLVTLQRITASGNRGGDGGIQINEWFVSGAVSVIAIIDSTVDNNEGSGLSLTGGELGTPTSSVEVVVQGSTLSRNTALEGAGIRAVVVNDGVLTVTNSTVSGNTADVIGGIFVDDGGSARGGSANVVIQHSTIANNTSDVGGAGGLGVVDVPVSVDHSIVAGNLSFGSSWDFDLDGAVGTVDYSLIQNSSGDALAAVDAGAGNVKDMDAQLGTLADNGGLTLTHLPLDGSPVIGAGDPTIAGAPASDQRGQTRVVGTIELGAVELQLTLAATGFEAAVPIGGGILLVVSGLALLVVGRRRLAR